VSLREAGVPLIAEMHALKQLWVKEGAPDEGMHVLKQQR
jgi:hypothetical protein